MAFEQRPNSGALFRNKKKTPSTPKLPDYTGRIDVGGTEFRLSGWIRKPKNGGDSFLSLSISAQTERQSTPAEVDDDIPF